MNLSANSPGRLHEYGKSISESPRPCASGGVKALLGCSGSSSFPSGHTAKATGAALLAAYVAPEKFQAFITRGQEYGESRIVAGQRYPFDEMASRSLTYQAVADLLAEQRSDPKSWLNAVADIAATRTGLFGGCGSLSAQTCADSRNGAFSGRSANKSLYDRTANYGFEPIGDRTVAMEVPKNAEHLIATRFGYAGSLFYEKRGLFLYVAAAPEPASWGMMVQNFGAMGAAVWRRPRPAAARA